MELAKMDTQTGQVSKGTSCQVCGSHDVVVFFEQSNVPVICNQLLATEDAAKEAKLGDVSLGHCAHCGAIVNYAFDPDRLDYNASYDNALHFSNEFQKFADRLAARLIHSYNLEGEMVAEIGCGDGYFLRLLLERGIGSAIGYDPSMSSGRLEKLPQQDGLTIIPEAFGQQELPDTVMAVLCRHVLEHIPDPDPFLSAIRSTIGERSCVTYFEVPNARWMLESDSLWDVIYEHVTYWTPEALTFAMNRAGLHPFNVETDFTDQYLMVEASPAVPTKPLELDHATTVQQTRQTAIAFGNSASRELQIWQERLSELSVAGGKAVLWGGVSKGVTFLNTVPASAKSIAAVIDVNDRKQGMYVSGTAHPITAPNDLAEIAPQLILVSNEIYLNEIKAMTAQMGLEPEFLTIAG